MAMRKSTRSARKSTRSARKSTRSARKSTRFARKSTHKGGRTMRGKPLLNQHRNHKATKSVWKADNTVAGIPNRLTHKSGGYKSCYSGARGKRTCRS